MAQEIKNTFLKSKMNKDLDDRILPNGEYRDARNISVGRSEDNDVGALENIIGNSLLATTDLGAGLTIIGIEEDNSTDRLFVFLTDYTDPNPLNPTNAPSSSKHYIYTYSTVTGSYIKLVEGEFLNFSTTNRIIGINLIENLLFWTDNRNQPRKINVNLATSASLSTGFTAATPAYYSQEHQISVAKYNPYQAISLYNRADLIAKGSGTISYFEVVGDRVAELLPFVGATVVSPENGILGSSYTEVTGVFPTVGGAVTRIAVSPDFAAPMNPGDYVSLIKSTMSNQSDSQNWPGDPDFLEDKFVRFSYRFKFDDNEYSLMAPFTQIAYIPKQKGYFINGDEDAAYQSTIVSFMENMVQNIGLVIPLPTSANRINRDYKITELEILFRESDGIAVKVLESINVGEISGASGINNYFTYDYQSRKPYKTLPEAQTVRVYDKVPVRAFSQETSGNRIIYGNFRDQHTPPSNINYNCRIAPKSLSGTSSNFVEYPNHSVKRNRNYQIGFVLADKFGRQSPVILSSVDLGASKNSVFYSGSTIYSAYDLLEGDTNPISWAGDAIQVLLNEPISAEIDLAAGTPGLYAIKNQYSPNTGEGFAITAGFVSAGVSPITDTTWTFTLDVANYPDNGNVPQVDNYLRGAYEDFVKVTAVSGPTPTNQYVVTTSGRINDTYLRTDNLPANTPDLKFAYTINDLGWYSYKIVVKQTEQEYYNVYLPGILNGYPGQSGDPSASTPVPGGLDNGEFPSDETNLTAHTVLFNDNINKIPRDLAEVGPDQKQYRSSVSLYGRVTNIPNTVVIGPPTVTLRNNAQYYPRLSSSGKLAISHTSTAVANAKDFNMGFSDLTTGYTSTANQPGGGSVVFYQIDTNPLIARISTTEKPIGAMARNTSPGQIPSQNTPAGLNMTPSLAVYETAPVESALNIYWETTSEGLIVDLNADISSTDGGANSFANIIWDFKESDTVNKFVTTDWFYPLNNQGDFLTNTTAELISQRNGNNEIVSYFELVAGDVNIPAEAGRFKIKFIEEGIIFEEESATLDVFSFVIRVTTSDDLVSEIPIIGEPFGLGALQNVAPSLGVAVPNVSKSINDQLLLDESVWDTSVNGSFFSNDPTSSNSKLGLRYSFSGGAGIPTNWIMNPNTGRMTQAIPGGSTIGTVGGEVFEGNQPGVYNIILKITDAQGVDTNNTTNLFEPLVFTQALTITLGKPSLNAGLVPAACATIQPQPTNAGPQPIATLWPKNYSPAGVSFSQLTSNCFYVADGSLDYAELGMSFTFDLLSGVTDRPQEYVAPSPPNNPGNVAFDVPIKVGEANHSQGTIVFNTHFYKPVTSTARGFAVNRVSYAWKEVGGGNGQWNTLLRGQEYNQVGKEGTSSEIGTPNTAAPFYDNPFFEEGNYNPFSTNGSETSAEFGPSTDAIWVKAVRAVDYASLGVSNPVQWRVIVRGLINKPVQNAASYESVVSWVTVDDLNNPTCVPDQGTNIVTTNLTLNNRYRYRVSTPSSNSSAYSNVLVGQPDLYATTPYGDYVDEFFLTDTGEEVYKPASSAPYINFSLNSSSFNPTLPLWTNETGTTVNLQWVAGFSSTTGVRLNNTNANAGVNAIQTTLNAGTINVNAGTLRVSQNI
jgi:hypothetical protein